MPYLLVRREQRIGPRTAAPALAITPTKFSSGFEIDLRVARTVDLIQVNGLPAPFLKRVRLEGSGDRAHWTLLVSEGTLFDLPRERLTQLELAFPAGDYRYLRLTWDDRSSGRMPLPAAVFARVVASTAPPPPTLTVPLTFTRRPSEPGKSRYAVRLPGTRLPIAALRLTVTDTNVLRNARVTEARLTGSDVAPAPLGAATLRRAAFGNAFASALEIPIDAPREDRVELTIDDGNNPPLALTSVVAVFAELPFVFFQAKAPGTLSARYGAPGLAAPSYDLEALRDSVGRLHLALAQWGDVVRIAEQNASPDEGIPVAGAPIDAARFRWSRAVEDSAPGLAVVRLDVAALAHSDLTDLRIVDPTGHQVPYLFEHLEGPLTDTLPMLERLPRAGGASAERAVTRYRLRLPFDSLDDAQLVLRTSARVFRRRIRLEMPAREDSRRAERTVVAASAEWAHAEPDTPAPALTMALPRAPRDAIEIVVDEGDNEPLPLDAPVLLLPNYELRFLSDGGGHARLLYGRRDLGPPQYDIALLGPRLVGVPANEASLAPEGAPAVMALSTMPGRVFWAVLIVAVLVILVIITRLVVAPPPVAEERAG